MGKASRAKRERQAARQRETDDAPQLGYAGLVATGATPDAAFDEIAADTDDPTVQAIFAHLQSTPEGRAMLEDAKAQWAALGLPAPWERTLELESKPNKAETEDQ